MKRRIIGIICLLCALSLLILIPLLAFTSSGEGFLTSAGILDPTPTPTPIPYPTLPPATPIPPITPQPILTVQGAPPPLAARMSYLIDADTGHVLADTNGERPVPMASTTKIITALIAIQSGKLDQMITVKQDAIDRVGYHSDGSTDGSSAYLKVGEQIKLKDLLYGLMLPSGDDAAVAIADALGGSTETFVQRMNLFTFRLGLFQTHYVNPDGLTQDELNGQHYTTAADLTRLATYAMKIPFFAQIVQTPSYSTANHVWTNTNLLLSTYPGMNGIKTGHTDAAGWCLVFSATRNGHHLIGAILDSSSQVTRDSDTKALLDWGFNLPVRPPN
ncbi:D-alanyl-D-alanine carboxypeptidase family protein [Tengunoibacter tsumagoiensis]|uniref:Peptidase S11 D-alanyl-D-alanine carboxypeptidase A N-terminal domain-containing protein n=1 Tax=Tengunoibacter tsumagoiensis TaxID=2014871 RepID=A0A401ZYC6_9CHLR|nr:serine hydrolase [Tengunoibacter tsumagoiensis]GCE11832.1 hypothetical protein KTT_16910 [Tengunoibacter tsumagoiensis]